MKEQQNHARRAVPQLMSISAVDVFKNCFKKNRASACFCLSWGSKETILSNFARAVDRKFATCFLDEKRNVSEELQAVRESAIRDNVKRSTQRHF